MVWVWVGSGWPTKNMGRVTSQSVFASSQKIEFVLGIFQVGSGRVESEYSDPFCPMSSSYG